MTQEQLEPETSKVSVALGVLRELKAAKVPKTDWWTKSKERGIRHTSYYQALGKINREKG